MKRIQKATLLILIFAFLTVFLTACNLDVDGLLDKVEEVAEKAEFPYSETGELEIALNFEGIQLDNYKGIYEWDIVYHDAGEDYDYNLVSYTDNSGSVKKSKFVFTGSGDVLTYIRTSDESIVPADATSGYVNETDKTVSDEMNTDFNEMFGAVMIVGTYGVVQMTDEDGLANWTFVTKRTDITIKDRDNNDLETVEYEYAGARDSGEYSDVKMLLNFKKYGITPILSRIRYEYFDESDNITKNIVVYLTFHTEQPNEADFVIPTAADGYTVG